MRKFHTTIDRDGNISLGKFITGQIIQWEGGEGILTDGTYNYYFSWDDIVKNYYPYPRIKPGLIVKFDDNTLEDVEYATNIYIPKEF